jgi:hypothetical protein
VKCLLRMRNNDRTDRDYEESEEGSHPLIWRNSPYRYGWQIICDLERNLILDWLAKKGYPSRDTAS